MVRSIPEILKEINSSLSRTTVVSLFATAGILFLFVAYLLMKKEATKTPITYISADNSSSLTHVDARPFGSKHGKTYTYDWCQGASRITSANRLYFTSADSAEQSGRTLSKRCQKK